MENPEFSVDAFSREMGVGRTVLFQKIKGITGSTPNNFIMNLRLKKAAYFLLNAPEMNISDILINNSRRYISPEPMEKDPVHIPSQPYCSAPVTG
jgi:hypothetical protein